MIEQDVISRLHRVENLCVVLAVAVLVAVGLAAWGLSNATSASGSAHRAASSARTVAAEARAIAHQASAFGVELADTRNQTILRDCRQQNHRHRATVRRLDGLLKPYAQHAHTAAQHRQLRASHRSTVLLIDALAPLQNCRKVLASSSGPSRSHGSTAPATGAPSAH